jgi:outer membrane lipoprotein
MALYEGFLDAAIYSEGREVTVAGEVKGKRVLPLGEIQYAYPLISIKELYLWPPKIKKGFFYPYPHWYYPWWYDPYWGPW